MFLFYAHVVVPVKFPYGHDSEMIYNLRIYHLQFIEFAGLRLKKSDVEAQLAAALGLKPRGVNGGISSALTSAP